MGRLCQGAVCRPRGCARLSLALHTPGRDLERPPDRLRQGQRLIPLQGLPPQRPAAQQVMTLDTHEFMRRFLLHVLPHGFHRIRHYGWFASATRKANIARVGELLAVSTPTPEPVETEEPPAQLPPCPCCGGRMRIIETFERWMQPRAPLAATGAPVVTRRGSFPRHVVAMSLRQTTPRAPTVEPALSLALIPARHPRKHPPALPDIGRDRQEMLSRCASNQAQSTSRPSTPAQPKHHPHKPRPAHRGFVPRRLPDACRRPKLFTLAEWRVWAIRTLMRSLDVALGPGSS
jgi:hypothetical protein